MRSRCSIAIRAKNIAAGTKSALFLANRGKFVFLQIFGPKIKIHITNRKIKGMEMFSRYRSRNVEIRFCAKISKTRFQYLFVGFQYLFGALAPLSRNIASLGENCSSFFVFGATALQTCSKCRKLSIESVRDYEQCSRSGIDRQAQYCECDAPTSP